MCKIVNRLIYQMVLICLVLSANGQEVEDFGLYGPGSSEEAGLTSSLGNLFYSNKGFEISDFVFYNADFKFFTSMDKPNRVFVLGPDNLIVTSFKLDKKFFAAGFGLHHKEDTVYYSSIPRNKATYKFYQDAGGKWKSGRVKLAQEEKEIYTRAITSRNAGSLILHRYKGLSYDAKQRLRTSITRYNKQTHKTDTIAKVLQSKTNPNVELPYGLESLEIYNSQHDGFAYYVNNETRMLGVIGDANRPSYQIAIDSLLKQQKLRPSIRRVFGSLYGQIEIYSDVTMGADYLWVGAINEKSERLSVLYKIDFESVKLKSLVLKPVELNSAEYGSSALPIVDIVDIDSGSLYIRVLSKYDGKKKFDKIYKRVF